MTKKTGPKNINIEIIEKIRDFYKKNNVTQIELAKQFNLSQSTISKIINNEIHKKFNQINISGSAEVKLNIKYGN